MIKPPRKRDPANQKVFEYSHYLTRGDVRVILGQYGYEGTEENVIAFVMAYQSTYQSAIHFTENSTYGGLEGMAIRSMIDRGELGVTEGARHLLYEDDNRLPVTPYPTQNGPQP